jgi:hypothetical protein
VPYVVVAVVVPIVLMGLVLVLERLEQRVLGAPAHAEEDLGAAPPPKAEREVVVEPPKAA